MLVFARTKMICTAVGMIMLLINNTLCVWRHMMSIQCRCCINWYIIKNNWAKNTTHSISCHFIVNLWKCINYSLWTCLSEADVDWLCVCDSDVACVPRPRHNTEMVKGCRSRPCFSSTLSPRKTLLTAAGVGAWTFLPHCVCWTTLTTGTVSSLFFPAGAPLGVSSGFESSLKPT